MAAAVFRLPTAGAQISPGRAKRSVTVSIVKSRGIELRGQLRPVERRRHRGSRLARAPRTPPRPTCRARSAGSPRTRVDFGRSATVRSTVASFGCATATRVATICAISSADSLLVRGGKRKEDVQARRARRLERRVQPEAHRAPAFTNVATSIDALELRPRSRIEIDHRVVGEPERVDARVPRIDGDGAELHLVQQRRERAADEAIARDPRRRPRWSRRARRRRVLGRLLLVERLPARCRRETACSTSGRSSMTGRMRSATRT